MDQPEAHAQGGLEADQAKGRGGEFHVLFHDAVGGVVAGDGVDGAVSQALHNGLAVPLAPQRRVHLGVGVKAQHRLVGEGEIVGRGLGGNVKAGLLGLPDDGDAAGGADVGDVEAGHW